MPPDGDEQLVPGERAAVLQLHGHLAGAAWTLDLRDLGLGHDLGALFAQASGDLLGGPRLFLGQQLRAAREECHLRPERCVGLRHLGPDDTAADDQQASRDDLGGSGLAVGPRVGLRQALDVGQRRLGTDRDDHRDRREELFVADDDALVPGDAPVATVQRDVVVFQPRHLA